KSLFFCLILCAWGSVAYADDAADCEKGTDWELVIRGCSAMIAQDPRNAQAYYKRGIAYLSKRDKGRAIEDFTKAIEIDPKHDKAYNSRGVAYGGWAADINREIEDYTKAIEINPKNEVAFLNRGKAYLGVGKYDLAFADYAKAIEVNPKSD